MTSYTATGLQDIYTRMLVGKVNKFPNIDTSLVADKRKFIGKSYLYIATGVLRQLTHFRCTAVSLVKCALHKLRIECYCLFGRFRIQTTDDPIVVYQFIDHITWQYTLRAIGYENLTFQFRTFTKMMRAIASVVPTGEVDSIT